MTARKPGRTAPPKADPLQELWEEYKAATVAMTKADRAEYAAAERAREAYPQAPKGLHAFAAANHHLITHVRYPYPEQRRVLAEAQMRDPARASFYSTLLGEWDEWQEACHKIDVAHGVPARECEAEKAECAWSVAGDRFADTPTTSLPGILLKLEYVADIDDLADTHAESPRLALPRVILGLIRDLRAELARPDQPAAHRSARAR